ncbi:hypothetical protein O6471_25130, partial [Salmonella enterica subsp. enterica]
SAAAWRQKGAKGRGRAMRAPVAGYLERQAGPGRRLPGIVAESIGAHGAIGAGAAGKLASPMGIRRGHSDTLARAAVPRVRMRQ